MSRVPPATAEHHDPALPTSRAPAVRGQPSPRATARPPRGPRPRRPACTALPAISVPRPRLPRAPRERGCPQRGGRARRAHGDAPGESPGRCGSRWPGCCGGSRRWAGRCSRWGWPAGWSERPLGWTEWLMVAAAALALVLVLDASPWRSAAPRWRIRAEVDPRRVTVGDPATGRIEVTNESRRPLLPLLVELPVGISAARFALPPLAPGQARTRSSSSCRPPPRRDPGGARDDRAGRPARPGASHAARGPSVTELFVHPRTDLPREPRRGAAARPRGRDDPGPVDVRPRLPRPARVPAGRRPPLHPLALLGQGRPAAGAAVPRHPPLAPGHRHRRRPRVVCRRRG